MKGDDILIRFKKYRGYLLIFLSLFLILSFSSLVLAANDEDNNNGINLPDASYFTPDMNASLKTVSPVLHMINWGIGIFGLFLVAWGIWKTLKIIYKEFTGEHDSEVKDIMGRLKPVGLGIIIVLFAVTGLWYKILVFLWMKITPEVEQGLKDVTQSSGLFLDLKRLVS